MMIFIISCCAGLLLYFFLTTICGDVEFEDALPGAFICMAFYIVLGIMAYFLQEQQNKAPEVLNTEVQIQIEKQSS